LTDVTGPEAPQVAAAAKDVERQTEGESLAAALHGTKPLARRSRRPRNDGSTFGRTEHQRSAARVRRAGVDGITVRDPLPCALIVVDATATQLGFVADGVHEAASLPAVGPVVGARPHIEIYTARLPP
jgi:hypothetical protein